MAQSEVKTRTKVNTDVVEPPMFKVIYLNDNQTAMEFVVDSLVTWFDYNEERAAAKTHDIHEAGSAVVAVLPYEIAEQKGIEITVSARSEGYPLQIKLEPEQA